MYERDRFYSVVRVNCYNPERMSKCGHLCVIRGESTLGAGEFVGSRNELMNVLI